MRLIYGGYSSKHVDFIGVRNPPNMKKMIHNTNFFPNFYISMFTKFYILLYEVEFSFVSLLYWSHMENFTIISKVLIIIIINKNTPIP